MPYAAAQDLPENVKNVLPVHAQHIYKEAFNSAYGSHKIVNGRSSIEDLEVLAHKIAWAAVKRKYAKGADDKWHRKEE